MPTVERLPFSWVMNNWTGESAEWVHHMSRPSCFWAQGGCSLFELSFCFAAKHPCCCCCCCLPACLPAWACSPPLSFPQPCCQLRSLRAAAGFCIGPRVWMLLGRSGHLLLALIPAEFLLLISGPQMLLRRRYFLASLPLLPPAEDQPQIKVPSDPFPWHPPQLG